MIAGYIWTLKHFRYVKGCPDQDGDGFADIEDAFPTESTQWNDDDDDGYGDNYGNSSGILHVTLLGQESGFKEQNSKMHAQHLELWQLVT